MAGLDAARPAALGERLGLPWTAASLDDAAALRKAIGDRRLGSHAAGPFTLTADPMRRACPGTGAHYIDITDAIPVFEATLVLDDKARRRGITMISPVGFDVVPSDCLALHLARAMPAAVRLELTLDAVSRPSAGTLKSVIEMLPLGAWRRTSGVLGRSTARPRDRRLDFGFEHVVQALKEPRSAISRRPFARPASPHHDLAGPAAVGDAGRSAVRRPRLAGAGGLHRFVAACSGSSRSA